MARSNSVSLMSGSTKREVLNISFLVWISCYGIVFPRVASLKDPLEQSHMLLVATQWEESLCFAGRFWWDCKLKRHSSTNSNNNTYSNAF